MKKNTLKKFKFMMKNLSKLRLNKIVTLNKTNKFLISLLNNNKTKKMLNKRINLNHK